MPQRFSLQQLGHQERSATFGADVMHDHEVGMIQRAGETGLLLEALQPLGIRARLRRR